MFCLTLILQHSVLLPSGTFLHRNFLCFIWHPAFEELRQWVVAHKTMPDDMTVSVCVNAVFVNDSCLFLFIVFLVQM